MKPTLVQYDAPGWGVGEVWLDGGLVVHSELPRPRRRTPSHFRVSDHGRTVVRRLERFFAGEDEDFARRAARTAGRLLRRVRAGAAAVPRGRGGDVRRAGRARRPPARRPRRRDVLRTLRPVAVHADAPRRLGGRDRPLRRSRRRRTSAACSRSKECRSEPVGGAPRRARRDRAGPALLPLAELSALFHARVPGTCAAGRGGRSRSRDLGGGPACVRAAARPRCAIRDPDVPAPGLRRRDALSAARRRGRRRARRPPRGRRALAAGAPLERPPKRVVGRSCCRTAYLRGALLGGGSLSGPARPAPRAAHVGRAGAEFLAAIAAREELELKVAERRSHARRLREGPRDDPGRAGARRRRAIWRCASRSTRSSRRRAREANRLANADEANLVRTARAAHRQLEAIRALGVDALPPHLAEIAELRLRHPPASLASWRRRRGRR